jgi:hypothetical protein
VDIVPEPLGRSDLKRSFQPTRIVIAKDQENEGIFRTQQVASFGERWKQILLQKVRFVSFSRDQRKHGSGKEITPKEHGIGAFASNGSDKRLIPVAVSVQIRGEEASGQVEPSFRLFTNVNVRR